MRDMATGAQENPTAMWRGRGLERRGSAAERLIEHQGPAFARSLPRGIRHCKVQGARRKHGHRGRTCDSSPGSWLVFSIIRGGVGGWCLRCDKVVCVSLVSRHVCMHLQILACPS